MHHQQNFLDLKMLLFLTVMGVLKILVVSGI